MSDEYLWDRTGQAEPDELELDRVMPRIRDRVQSQRWIAGEAAAALPSAMPRHRRAHTFAVWAVAASVALLAAAGAGWLGGSLRSERTALAPEPDPSVIAATPGGSAPREPDTRLDAVSGAPTAKESTVPPLVRAVRPEEPSAERSAGVPKNPFAASAPSQNPRGTGPEPEATLVNPFAAPTASEPLRGEQIRAVIAKHRAAVKETCWEPAVAARRPNAPDTARVTTRFTIGANGGVSAVNPSADPPGYPGLSACVARQIRTWRFPTATQPTTLSVPFVFSASP